MPDIVIHNKEVSGRPATEHVQLDTCPDCQGKGWIMKVRYSGAHYKDRCSRCRYGE